MAEHMPDNGMQCVMFTHQDTGVWSDMVGIFWAAGLQVVAAWYIATETTSEYPSWSSRIGGPIAIGFDESVGSLDELAHERDDGNLGGLSRLA